MKIKHSTFLILILFLHFPLQAQTHNLHQIELTEADRFQKKGFIRGWITDFKTNSPVCLADIFCSRKTSFTRSNSEGEFILGPLEFPATLTIRKFGFKEETVIINNLVDPVLVSLTPTEVHKSYSGNKRLLQYELIFNKALGKFNAGYIQGLQDNSQRHLVWCRITSSVDTTVNTLFESYAQMNVYRNGLLDYQPLLSRYAADDNNIPGLSGNRLEFKTDPYVTLPIMAAKYITGKSYILQDTNQIALVKVDLGYAVNTYYINVADTSVVHITSTFRSGRKERIPATQPVWRNDKIFSAEISFSHLPGNTEDYFIDWISTSEQFTLLRKNKAAQVISKHTIFVVVSDSSNVCNAVRDESSNETLTEMRKQINFRSSYLLSRNSSDFDSETEKLLMKPYNAGFWSRNSFIMPGINERKQITKWEKGNNFYSEDRLPHVKETISTDSIVGLMNHNLIAVENVYVDTDRPDYLAGDTIWFSAFVLDNLHMDSTSLSRILYADLINSNNIAEKHLKLIINNGRTHGDFVISRAAKNGIYRLRAYTQYMRNFQGEYLFEKEIRVHQSDFTKLILVNPAIRKSTLGDSVELHIKTLLPDEYQAQDKSLEVIARLNDTLNVRKTFTFKKTLNETMGFFVPSSLSCKFTDIRLILSGDAVISEQRLSIPLRAGINLQFFPESGKMVDGINSFIACKATDDMGNPAPFDADIIDENDNMIRHISGNDSGVSKFEFTPVFNQTYRANINLNGSKYSFNLPAVEPKGYVLNFDADSSDILIKYNNENLNGRHYLLLSVRGAVYAAIETKPGDRPLKIHLPLNMYPKGIVQVTLYDSLFRPQAERLVFNNRLDQKMYITAVTDKKIYSPGEKVSLTFNVTDASGNPLRSSLSLAVADASKSDSVISCPDIESYLYLTSELKGGTDYQLLNLSDTTQYGNAKRDLVMMTQGWRNYLWNSIRYTNTYKVIYPIEKGFSIGGSVYSLSNSGSLSGYKLNYLDLKSGLNGITEVDQDNKFNIEIPFHYNSHDYFIQNKNIKEKIGNLGFVLDTFPLPPTTYRKNELPFLSYKAGYLNAIDRKFSEIDSSDRLFKKYIKIPEVKITAKSDHSGYSAPDKSIDLNKTDPTGKKYSSLFQLIYQEFGEKAFTATGYGTGKNVYFPILVVNGAPMTASECPPCYDQNTLSWAMSIPIREISDVKFYEAQSKYSQWLSPPPPDAKWKTDATGKFALYRITFPKLYLPVISLKTSSKYRGNPRGTIIFAHQGIYMAREFYQPDYEKKNIPASDNRTTIFWAPEIQTDSTGRSKVSFYNSDLKGKALIRISGVSYQLKDASSAILHYLSN